MRQIIIAWYMAWLNISVALHKLPIPPVVSYSVGIQVDTPPPGLPPREFNVLDLHEAMLLSRLGMGEGITEDEFAHLFKPCAHCSRVFIARIFPNHLCYLEGERQLVL